MLCSHLISYFPKASFLFSIFLLFFTDLSAQYALKGTITAKGIRLKNTTVRIFRDSVLYRTAQSDNTGQYEILQLTGGSYSIICSSVGYQNSSIMFHLTRDTSIHIELVSQATTLAEVNVRAQRPLIERKIDRLVFNVEYSILSKGVSAIDVLRETPRIEVTGNDGIKMIGKDGLKVMIDGRLLNLSDDDVKNRLRSLRSDDIASIEVIPVPPAKYSAAGNSGLINIVLKKNPLLGWKGSVNASYLQRIYPSYTQSANINYKANKLEASISLGNDHMNIVNERNILYDLFVDKKALNTIKYVNGISNRQSAGSVVKYRINPAMEVGATVDYSRQNARTGETENNNYMSGEPAKVTDSSVNSISAYKGKSAAVALSAYFDYNLDTAGKKMSITYNYSLNTDLSSRFVNSFILIGPEEKNAALAYFGDNNYQINSLMADFELPYHFANIETGGAFSHISNTTGLKLFDNVTGHLVPNVSGTNDFAYSEKTAALYLSASKTFNRKWSGKMGLRYEQTFLEGFSPTLNLKNNTSYGKLFPSVFVLYSYGEGNSLSLAYSKRIQRPGFYDLNPFRYYSGIYSYTSGNAFLLPSFSHNVELAFTYRNNLSFILSGARSLSNSGYIAFFADGINKSMPENYFNQHRAGLDVSYTYSPARWWNLNSSGNINYNQTRSYVPSLQIPDTDGYAASVRLNSTFTLNKKGTTFWSLSYNHFFPSRNGFNEVASFGYMSTNFRFSAMKKNLNFMISALDIFQQNYTVTKMQYRAFSSTSVFNAKMQNIRLSITYNFGNNKVKNISKESKNTDRHRAE